MPELPEVETIVRGLRAGNAQTPGIVGKTILGAEVYWAGTVAQPTPKEFIRRIAGQQILSIGRRGKFLVFQLSEDALLVHLRMSGDLLVGLQDEKLAAHVRVALQLSDGLQLAFNNPRKFGRMWLVDDPQTIFSKLGPEPLDEELTPAVFSAALANRSRQLKPLLLDQEFIAGLGNIYTDEALHMAKLHPLQRANTLSSEQAASLLFAIRQVLEEGIRRNGASIDWVYRGGDFQNHFRVYQRTDQPCLLCGTSIQRIVVGQRGTHYCPVCQPVFEEY